MDSNVKDFFSKDGGSFRKHFYDFLVLDKKTDFKWSELSKQAPDLCKGWFELSHLETQDRIEFTRDFWISKLPYRENLNEFLHRFFSSLDDVFVVLTKEKKSGPFKSYMVYSLAGDAGFFRGAAPAKDKDLVDVQKLFPDYLLPEDYQAFLKIHNGLWKTTDSTGLLSTSRMPLCYREFQLMVEGSGGVKTSKGVPVNPKSLIPFYESFGMPFFQCFWSEWYPEQEMGNVYYAANLKTISDIETGDSPGTNLSFPTFTDWLMFYLEKVD